MNGCISCDSDGSNSRLAACMRVSKKILTLSCRSLADLGSDTASCKSARNREVPIPSEDPEKHIVSNITVSSD